MAKNYFAIVHKTTGTLLVKSGSLPIFWLKKIAQEEAKGFNNYIVQPVDIKELEKLILSKVNKKAK